MARGGKKPGIGAAAATGLLFDSEIRSAAARAALPVARLAFAIAKRAARQAARRRAEQLGLIELPGRGRRLASPVLAGSALAAAAVYLSDPERRQKVQRLVVH
jgi:hypothetical protein